MAETDSLERIRKALEACKAASDPNIPAHVYMACREELENACNPNAIRSLLAREAALREALKLAEFAMDDCPMASRQLTEAITLARAALASTEPTGGHE